MRITIDKPGVYELQLVHETKPPVVIPTPEDPVVIDPPVEKPTKTYHAFTCHIDKSNVELHIRYPDDSALIHTDESVAAYPMSVVNVQGKLWYYKADRANRKGFVTFPEGQTVGITLDGQAKGFEFQDVVYHDDTFKAMFEIHNQIWYAESINGRNFNRVFEIDTFGAKDTRHCFGPVSYNGFLVYGRQRGADWGDSNKLTSDRRGIKEIYVYYQSGESKLIRVIDPIDWYKDRTAYKQDNLKLGFYSSDGSVIGEDIITNVGVYFQHENRPTGRADRPAGTGQTFPVPMNLTKPKAEFIFGEKDSWVPLLRFLRPSHDGVIEVGQIHASSFVEDGDDYILPASVRNDTHYKFGEILFKATEHWIFRFKKQRLAYLTNGTFEMEGIKSFDYDGRSPHYDGKVVTLSAETKLYKFFV